MSVGIRIKVATKRDISIKDIADLIEYISNRDADTGCPIRNLYSVLRLVDMEIGERMRLLTIKERDNAEHSV